MHLVSYTEELWKDIEAYQLDDASYTGIPKEIILANKDKEDFYPILCFKEDRLVCFFALDGSSDREVYTTNEKSFLIRAFSTDSREVRKGYATQSLTELVVFLNNNFAGINEIVLGVNEKNPNAYKMYLKAGFIDTEKKHLGPRGYQHVMQLRF